ISSQVHVQNSILVKGRVTDAQDKPIANASVVVKGTSTGVTTSENGDYQITAPSNGTLIITSVGYPERQMAINGQSTHNVTLTATSVDLDQVVVIGYGTQRKKD